MERELISQLIDINRKFYSRFADSFSETRQAPQPGFTLLLDYLPKSQMDLLDVGCGDARFIRYLKSNTGFSYYVGVDFSSSMLQIAERSTDAKFYEVDLNLPGCLEKLGSFDVISCLATLQHIPGRHNRARLIGEINKHLRKGGRLLLSNWQFLESPRQRKKILDWSEIGMDESELEENDYLIAWNRNGHGHRYVALITLEETRALARSAGMKIIDSFRSDGREGNLNLYTVLSSQS